MAQLFLDVKIYDPAISFETVKCQSIGFDSWYDECLIRTDLLKQLPQVMVKGQRPLRLSSGMAIDVPYVEIGIQVGSIKIDKAEALVVDHGNHDILLGSALVERAFEVGRTQDEDVKVTSDFKDDVTALSIELYPVIPPVELRLVENAFHAQRQLHNIGLLAAGDIPMPPINQLASVINDDQTIPDDLRLRLTWIDTGSIWITLKSGSEKALKYVASLLHKGASAKLAQEMAEAKKNENDASVSEETRKATIDRINSEQEKLRAENIAQTYAHWREEVRQRIQFFDELLAQVSDPAAVAALKAQRDMAVIALAEQQLMPIVRNVPRPFEPPAGIRFLPPPKP